MFLARIVFFRLHESPRFLVHAGRPQEALESLQLISRFNGSDLDIDLQDVEDYVRPAVTSPVDGGDAAVPFLHSEDQAKDLPPPTASDGPQPVNNGFLNNGSPTDYHSTGESPTPLDSHLFSPVIEQQQPKYISAAEPEPAPVPRTPRPPGPRRTRPTSAPQRRASSIYEKRLCNSLPRWVRKPLWAWWDRVLMVLTPEWRRTTLLVWIAWWAMALGTLSNTTWAVVPWLIKATAYTMFNVFLPKLLETGSSSDPTVMAKTLEDSLWDIVYYTIGGLPGAIVCISSFFVLMVTQQESAFPAWSVYDRVPIGKKVVFGGEHIYHGLVLCDLHSRRVFVGGEGEHGWDQS